MNPATDNPHVPPSQPAEPPQQSAGETVTVTEPKPSKPEGEEQRFTASQLEAARRQEKDKLYGRLENGDAERKALLEELATLRKEREERTAAEGKQREEAEAAAKAKKESEMSAKSLLEQRTQEWEQRFQEMQAEREREREVMTREAEFNRLRAYTQERLAAERSNIAPELVDLVGGNTQEEIDRSIDLMKDKTNTILANVQQAQTANRSQMRGVSTAGYTTQGPTDNESGSRSLSAADIKNMSMSEYARYREQLLGAASANGNGRGLFN